MAKEMTMKEFQDYILSTLEKTIDERFDEIKQLLQKAPSGSLGNHNPERPEEKIAKFFQYVFEGNIEGIKGLGVGVNGGQYLVPEEFVGMVLEKLPQYSAFRKVATVYPAKKLSGNMPIELDDGTAYWVGSMQTVPESTNKLGNLNYQLHKLMAKLPVDNDILAYSDVDLVAYLSKAFSKAISRAEDNAFTNGDGNGKPKGIRSYSGIATISNNTLTYDVLVKAKNKVDYEFSVDGVWMTSQRGLEMIEGLTDNNGRPLLNTYNDGKLTLFGKPVVVNKHIPSNLGQSGNGTEIYFGDFSKYIIFDGKQIEIKMFEHPDVDAQILRIKSLVDGQLAYEEALVKVVIAD